MWWALFWAIIIASTASAEYAGGTAGLIAFLVIWHFAHKAEINFQAGERVESELKSQIADYEGQVRRLKQRPETTPHFQGDGSLHTQSDS